MPRSSRHKSHKTSKHKEAKDYYSDSDEDVKMKEKNSTKEEGVSVRSKESGHSASGEKRKLSSSLQLKEGKDGKDLGNGDASEEHVSSKRRKEKLEGGSGIDRWNGGGDEKVDVVGLDKESSRIDSEKGLKSKESKGSGDSKSRSSKRHESGGEKEEKNTGLIGEKEEGRSGSRSESKRKSEKESGRKESKELKEKDRGYDRDKRGQESKRELEMRGADGDLAKKQASQLEDAVEDRPGKRSRENNELTLQDECRNPELEKELEKRIRRRREGSNDRDRYQDARETDERHLTSRVDRGKDGKYKDERYKDGSYGDKYQETAEKDDRHRGEKYRDDSDKYREDVDRDGKRRDDKYHEDGDRENRRREDKYREDGDRDRRRDDKYREDGERDGRRRDDKYREDSERDNKRRDDKYREDGDKDIRRDDRYYDDAERDDKYREDGDRYKEDKRREDYEKETRYRDGKQGDDVDREKRVKDAKYRDERYSRDRSGDKSDAKHVREDSHSSDLHYRKTSIRDGSPNYDDRARTKEDQGRKRSSDKEDQVDVRSRSTKDQRYDSEKRSSSIKVDQVTDRGRSSSRNADLELTPSRGRHQGSPSSVARDHYRVSKQDELKYREYAYEERVRHTTASIREYGSAGGVNEKISSSRSIEKVVQKEDGHLGDLSAERRLKLDMRASPRQLIDRSPSSTSAERRHFSRSDVRRSIDVEESGQRSGGSKDPKDYSGKEGRASREMALETHAGDELSLGDGDTLSVSSPFVRANHLSSGSKSHLPPLFRTAVDSPTNFGSSEDDSRMKFGNRHRRMSDPNMGRVPGSPWKGIPNWPSPVANGFMPFQHGPPVAFHPVMPQFPGPPMFGVRPSMELNHPGVPYHITDPDRFSAHGRSMGWRNPVDDSIPPPLHGWDTNSSVFGDESHLYGRPDWEHGRSILSGRGWETSGDMWKGPKGDASMELPSASDKENQLSHGSMDVASAGQSENQAKSEQMHPDVFAESIETVQSSDALEKKTPKDATPTLETINVPKMSEKDDIQVCNVYLSMLDISAELTDPELYGKYTDLLGQDEKRISFPEHSKILFVEDAGNVKQKNPSLNSLFSTINDSLFQKAATLYKKQKENFSFIGAENSAVFCTQNTSFLKSNKEKQDLEDNIAEDFVPAGDETQPGDVLPNCGMVVQLEEVPLPNCGMVVQSEEVPGDVLTNCDMVVQSEVLPNCRMVVQSEEVPGDVLPNCDMVVQSEEVPGDVLPNCDMEVQLEEVPNIASPKLDETVISNILVKPEEKAASAADNANPEDETVIDLDEVQKRVIDNNTVSLEENAHPSGNNVPASIEEVILPSNSTENHCAADRNEEEEEEETMPEPETKFGSLVLSEEVPSSKACEVEMVESVESGSVNLSRIHHSPESTH